MNGTAVSLNPTATPRTFAELIQAPTAPAVAAAAAVPMPKRKNQAALSAEERGRFRGALTLLNEQGVFGQLVSIHSDMSHTMHNMGPGGDPSDPTGALGQQRFLPWHRVYLYQLEQALQSIHPEVTIPYWDWSQDTEQRIPEWLHDFTPTVQVPYPGPGTVSVMRAPEAASVLAGIANRLGSVNGETDYTRFATGLERIHNGVHVWVGGVMVNLSTASADPIFWMHHANVDRIWWQWQRNAGKGLNPTLNGNDAIMDPWRYTEADTRDAAAFNYVYE